MLASGNIPHALLFAGPYGAGKAETAFELARLLLCERGHGSGCGVCGSCVRAARLEHPDLHVLFPFRAKPETNDGEWFEELDAYRRLLAGEPYPAVVSERGRQIVIYLVNEVRERLLESSLEGGRKVCVILGAEHLNAKTANSLLKILEEPPEGVQFILTAERVSSVLPTIVSRASVIRFRRLREEEIAGFLAGIPGITPERRDVCARLAGGSIRSAKAFALDRKDDLRERAFDLYERAAAGNPDDAVSSAAGFLWSKETVNTEELVGGFALYTKSVLEWKCGIPPRAGGRPEMVRKLAESADFPALDRLSARLQEGLEMLGRNVGIALIMTKLLCEIHDTYR